MKRGKTLLIVDMQPDFSDPPCRDRIGPVCTLIRLAKKNKWNIINLLFDKQALDRWDDDDDYDDSDTTAFKEIDRAIGNYKNSRQVIKRDSDGGYEVYECLRENSWEHDELIVCGCYADQCVLETISRLKQLLPSVKMTMVKKALKPCYKFPYSDYKQLNANVHIGTYISLTL
jgi:nicotinamidase-related amidase